MKTQRIPTILAILSTSVLAVLLLTGASSKNESGSAPWAVSAVSGQKTGLYIMNQKSGDIFFLNDPAGRASNRADIKKLGNISDAR